MKIIFTVTNDLRQDQRMHRICGSLQEHGFEVMLVGRRNIDSPAFYHEKYNYYRIFCFSRKGFLFYAEYNIRLLFYLLFSKADVFCSVDLDTIIPVTLVAGLKRKLLVHDAHEYFEESIEIVHRPAIKLIWKWIGKRFIPKADHHYTVNSSLASIFEKKYGKTFEVILNVPEGEANKSIKRKNRRIVLYQGILNEGRGLELLIEVAKELPIELWIVGEGRLAPMLKNLVDQNDLNDKVLFWGFKTGTKLKEITLKADIGVNILDPSSGNYSFSLANRTFDFIQAGLPAIHMNFVEHRWVNDQFKTAELIDHYSVDSISTAISKLMQDEEYYNELQNNCTKAASVFNWKYEKNKLIELYERWT